MKIRILLFLLLFMSADGLISANYYSVTYTINPNNSAGIEYSEDLTIDGEQIGFEALFSIELLLHQESDTTFDYNMRNLHTELISTTDNNAYIYSDEKSSLVNGTLYPGIKVTNDLMFNSCMVIDEIAYSEIIIVYFINNQQVNSTQNIDITIIINNPGEINCEETEINFLQIGLISGIILLLILEVRNKLKGKD